MRRQTRTVLLNIASGIAIAATALMLLMPATSFATGVPQPEPDPGAPAPEPEPDPGTPQPEPDPGTPQPQPDPGPGIDLGPGFTFEFEFGDDFDGAYVCFYSRTRMRGERFCMEPGDRIRNLGDFSDQISSIENPYGLRVTVCTRTNFNGSCATIRDDADYLGDFDDEISSIRVRD